MNRATETIATLLTAEGRSAIAVIELRGPSAAELIDRHFVGRSSVTATAWPVGKVRYGQWQAQDYREDLVVTRRADDHFEILSHGGLAAPHAILHHLNRSGCQIESLLETAVRKTGSRLKASALLAASTASTPRVATLLEWQIQGALDHAIASLLQDLDCPGIDLSEIDQRLQQLRDSYRFGRRSETPASVVIAGPPNAGKSSLVNAILGFTRTLVFDRPGTTRDVVESTTVIDGWPVLLSDTAGQRHHTLDPLEKQGIERGVRAMQAADLVLAMRPLVDPSAAADLDESHHWQSPPAGPRCLWISSKIDRCPHLVPPLGSLGTSVLSGAGLEALLTAVGQRLSEGFPNEPQAMLFSQAQFEAVSAAQIALQSHERGEARRCLSQLL